MKQLTEKQEEIYLFIKNHIMEKGYQPNLREIGKHFGIVSTNGVASHLNLIERKGYIKNTGKSRAIVILK